MSVVINKAVVHRLNKEQHQEIQKSSLRDQLLPLSDPTVVSLIEGVIDAYGKKGNSLQYGVFDNSGSHGEAPQTIKDYYTNIDGVEDSTFLSLTNTIMKELHREARSTGPATGGHILFIDYQANSSRFLLVAMVKQKPGFGMKGLDVQDLQYIDLGKLHSAARFSFQRWTEYLTASSEEQNDICYLTFIGSSANNESSQYFVRALGCKAGSPSAKATKGVVIHGTKFFRSTEGLDSYADEFKRKVTVYLTNKEANPDDKTARLSEVVELARGIFAKVDIDTVDDLTENLFQHLNSEDVGVPAEFSVNKNELKKLTHIIYKDEALGINFDRGDLGTDSGSRIWYKNGQLTISKLPPKLKADIERQLGIIE
ncbi:nucleoid-associated protein [Grimontia hollisae]|uniref:nucleoid-associated protein n=1 Tax=Grimontia hollisae TaxID=673 RepID=UPI00130309C0|nr:nucleoid-associated protein [Grimontia hollisae]